MKNVGLYAVIIQNSSQKLSWKQYGFTKFDEQINLLFEVLLYIMEQSLKEEKCTMDDIATYIDTINVQYLRKDISYEQCHQLGDFIVNTVLSNEGRPPLRPSRTGSQIFLQNPCSFSYILQNFSDNMEEGREISWITISSFCLSFIKTRLWG